ncbi:putative u6 snrna-associated sm protein lsm1, partial [Blyttiomyces helicus]
MDNFLPGSASLVDCVDKKILVTLRDGRNLLGWLRSYDQFANLVLQDTVERTHVADGYSDAYRGVFVIRGENVVLLGEI